LKDDRSHDAGSGLEASGVLGLRGNIVLFLKEYEWMKGLG
jgi:hypothetical protein